jgi:hypothetical protein
MTTITFVRIGELELNADGRVVNVPTAALAFDSDLRDIAALAMASPGQAIPVPSKARVPRPRHSTVHSISQ